MISSLDESDARAMVGLVADVAGLQADHSSSKRFLMDGLVKMIGADSRAWMLAYIPPEKPPVHVSIQHGGFSEERFARIPANPSRC
jgi:hypothetical protein